MGLLIRLALLALVAYIIFRVVRAALGSASPPPQTGAPFEPMGRCERCGTYLPQSRLPQHQQDCGNDAARS